MSEKVSVSRASAEETPLFEPFRSLADAMEGPRSAFFGVTPQRRPRDPVTRYPAGGVSGAEEPPGFHLSFEITNHRLLCSVSSTGQLRNPCIFSRRVPAHRRGQSFMGEQLLGGSPWSLVLRREGGAPISLHTTHGVAVDLLGDRFPLFTYRCEGLQVRLLTFVPERDEPAAAPRAVLTIVEVSNPDDAPAAASLLVPGLHEVEEADPATALASPVESPHPRFTENPVPIQPGYEAVLALDDTAWQPAFPEVGFTLAAGARRIFTFAFVLGDSVEDVRDTAAAVRAQPALAWLNQTWERHTAPLGRLSIPDDPYYAESYVPLVEEAQSSLLYATDGAFWTGGPSGFGDYGLTLFAPQFVAELIANSFAHFTPRPAGEAPPTGPIYSLTGLLGALPQAGLYYRMTGDKEFFLQHPQVLGFARECLGDLLARHTGGPFLFDSAMLWDGPTRGDFHTGSNLLAWYSFASMARLAREVYGEPELAAQWEAAAMQMKADLFRYCAGEGSIGPRFFEGANADGSFVLGHDGEEAFTTLMPFFGFCETDDPRYVNHNRLALSPENPIYAPGVDGIWWVGDRWTGEWGKRDPSRNSATTMPGQMTMLAGNHTEAELHARLEQIRALTDLDGSLWWWPYSSPGTDPGQVRRRDVAGCDLSKSSYVATLYLCLFVNNVLGLSVDAPARRVSFRPFSPWPRFTWEGCRLGATRFDFRHECRDGVAVGEIVNRNQQAFDGTIELLLPAGARVVSCRVNGRPSPKAEHTERFGRPAVRLQRPIAPGERLTFEARYKTGI